MCVRVAESWRLQGGARASLDAAVQLSRSARIRGGVVVFRLATGYTGAVADIDGLLIYII